MKFLEKYWWIILALVAVWYYVSYRYDFPGSAANAAGGDQDWGG